MFIGEHVVYSAIGNKEFMQVVPIPGGFIRASAISFLLFWLVKETDPGPYIEGVSNMLGVLVCGLILAVVIARISNIIGITNDEIINFLSLMKFSDLFSNSAKS